MAEGRNNNPLTNFSILMINLAKTLEKMKEEHEKEMEKVVTEKANIQNATEKKENGIQEDQIVNYIDETEDKEIHISTNTIKI